MTLFPTGPIKGILSSLLWLGGGGFGRTILGGAAMKQNKPKQAKPKKLIKLKLALIRAI